MVTVPTVQEQLNEADQRENACRERAAREATALIEEARTAFARVEDNKRRQYDEYRAQLLLATAQQTLNSIL